MHEWAMQNPWCFTIIILAFMGIGSGLIVDTLRAVTGNYPPPVSPRPEVPYSKDDEIYY